MLVLEWKEIAFIEKVNSSFFCWFPAAILVHQNGAPIWRLHTKLYKGAWNVSANNSETVGHKDLRLGQIVYILAFYHHNISFSWLKGNKREETFREHYTPNLTAGSVVRCQIKNGGCCGQKKTRFKCSARGKWPAENNSIVSDGTLVLPNHNSVVVWSQ